MSGSQRPPAPVAPPSKPRPKSTLSAEDLKELALLDATFKRIKGAVPAAPYILSTPSLDPYRYHSEQERNSFMIGHLFAPDEEHLQYRTFHYREPYQDVFVLEPGEEDIPEVERPKPQPASTPHQGPKKKISLSAYKSRQVNGIIAPGSKTASPSLAPTKPRAQTNGAKEDMTPAQPPPPSRDDAVNSHKRPATDVLIPEKPEKRAREERLSPQPQPQPQPKTEIADPKANPDRSNPSNGTPHGLPPLLSPVDQPLDNPYGLPAILSPTLPSNVQAELDKLEMQRKRGDSNASTSSSDKKSQTSSSDKKSRTCSSDKESQSLAVPDSRPQKRDGDDQKSTPCVRSTSTNGKSPRSSMEANHGTVVDASLIVKLKYGKRQGTAVTRLLNLPQKKVQAANEKKERQELGKERLAKTQVKSVDSIANKGKETSKPALHPTETRTPNAKAASMSTKVAEKRPRTEDDASSTTSSKRPKPSQDGPMTPSRHTATSPALSNKSSAQKSQGPYTTPRKDLKAISMLRTSSAEGYDSTPGRSGSTPSSTKHLDPKAAPTSVPLGGKKQADYQSLAHTSQKLNFLGRSLKHQVQNAVVEKGKQLSKEDNKRAAITSLECIISYMAAYGAQDQSNSLRGRPGDVEATWKTLLPLCASYAARTKEFPHLDGLRLYLCTVICAAICAHVAPRAPRPKAHDSPQNMPQAELAKQLNQVTENFALLSKYYTHLLQAVQEARIILPVENIQEQYPKTWAGREKNAKLAKGSEKLNAGNLSGPYFLPIQNDTTPFQAARFGLSFLREYCDKEELGYKLRVNLQKPE